MSYVNVIRAGKDEEFRLSHTRAEQVAPPDTPDGVIELSNEELAQIVGGTSGNKDLAKLAKKLQGLSAA